jgi:amidase
MTLEEYAACDGLALAELVRKGEVHPAELAELALAGIEKVNPQLNAVIETFPQRIDELRSTLIGSGPFAGVPFVVKDFPIYRGVKAEFGSELAQGNVARRDSNLGVRLRDAGLVNLGRTTSSEFGLAAATETRLYGPTGNPWDPARSCAGSSGGAGAITAAGAVPFAQGGDAGGSIRMPAAFCGLVGLKSTRGRVSSAPADIAPIHGLAIGFLLTRTLRDCAALLDAAEGPAAGDHFEIDRPRRPYLSELERPCEPLRIGFTGNAWSGVDVDASLASALRRTAELCESLGHRVEEASPEFDYEPYLEAQKIIWWAHTRQDIDSVAAVLGREPSCDNLLSTTWAMYERGGEVTATELLDALATYNGVSRRVGEFFSRYDVLVTPTCTIEPRPLGSYDPDAGSATPDTLFDQLAPHETFTALFNATGLPAISLPLHQSNSGLPLGMQFVAGFGAEDELFRLAAALEQAQPWRDRRPAVHVAE